MASTSFGRLFRLSLGSTGGKYHLTSHPFSRPQSSLSLTRIFPLWSSNPQTERGYINSVALGNATSTGREIFVAVDTRVQIWSLRFEGYEELISEEDLGESIREAIRDFTPTTSRRGSGVELDVELLDIVLESSSKVVLLVSYAGVDDENSMMMVSNNPRRIYALVSFSRTPNAFAAEDAIVVPYQSVSVLLIRVSSTTQTLSFRLRALVHLCIPVFSLFATARWLRSNLAMPSLYALEVRRGYVPEVFIQSTNVT